MAGFKEKRPGRSPQDLNQIETEPTDFIETSATIKLGKVSLYFLLL
jgi:hypothetical protein